MSSKSKIINNFIRLSARLIQRLRNYSDANLVTAKGYSDDNLVTAKSYAEAKRDEAKGYAKDYTDTELAKIHTFRQQKVASYEELIALPNPSTTTLYLVPVQDAVGNNFSEEYIYDNETTPAHFEHIGNTSYTPDHEIEDDAQNPGYLLLSIGTEQYAIQRTVIETPTISAKYNNVVISSGGDNSANPIVTTGSTADITIVRGSVNDSTIYYTLDGSEPTTSSTPLPSSLKTNITIETDTITPIDQQNPSTYTVVFKAKAFSQQGRPSAVFTYTFYITRKLKTPTISVDNPTSGQTQGVVSITNPNGRGVIRYTTGGDAPTSDSPEFTSLSVNTKTTIKAAVFLDNWVTSDVAEKQQTFTVLEPTISVGGNTYDASRTITVSSNTPDASLTYQTKKDNGAWSEETSITSGGTFTLETNGSYQVKVNATKDDWNGSEASSSFNVRKVQTPTITVAPGTEWDDMRQITIAAGSAGGTLKYSTDGGSTWNTYSAPFNVSAPFNGKIKAKAVKDGYTDSNVAESSTITLKLKCYIGRTAGDTISALSELLDKKTINATTLVGREESNTFTASGRIWFIVPSGQTITKITSGGYKVPVELVANQISGYNCYRRVEDDNAGTFTYNFE